MGGVGRGVGFSVAMEAWGLKRNLQAVPSQRHRQQMGADGRKACWEV